MTEIKWFACSDDIIRMGPFDSEVEAWEAVRAAPPTLSYRDRIAGMRLPPARVHVPGAQVWPERVKIKSSTKKKEKKS